MAAAIGSEGSRLGGAASTTSGAGAAAAAGSGSAEAAFDPAADEVTEAAGLGTTGCAAVVISFL